MLLTCVDRMMLYCSVYHHTRRFRGKQPLSRRHRLDDSDQSTPPSTPPPSTPPPSTSAPSTSGCSLAPATPAGSPSSSDSEDHPTNRPCRRRTMPSRYRRDSDDDSDQNDGTICSLCQSNEPGTMAASIVFWIDCNKCGCWVHNFCAFGNNTSSRRYLCPKCSHQ